MAFTGSLFSRDELLLFAHSLNLTFFFLIKLECFPFLSSDVPFSILNYQIKKSIKTTASEKILVRFSSFPYPRSFSWNFAAVFCTLEFQSWLLYLSVWVCGILWKTIQQVSRFALCFIICFIGTVFHAQQNKVNDVEKYISNVACISVGALCRSIRLNF